MKITNLNLARRPFVNTRPIGRMVLLLWILGGLLLLDNLVRYWNYFSASDEKVAELVAAEERIEALSQKVTQASEELASLDLASQNAQVRFLNRKIASRTFSWSRLFDDLGEVLPDDVRLTSLSPLDLGTDERGNPAARRRLARSSQWPGESFELGIEGIAKTGDDQLVFIDRLFEDPAFDSPSLRQDSDLKTGGLRFNLAVLYHPAVTFESLAQEARLKDSPGAASQVEDALEQARSAEASDPGGDSESGDSQQATPPATRAAPAPSILSAAAAKPQAPDSQPAAVVAEPSSVMAVPGIDPPDEASDEDRQAVADREASRPIAGPVETRTEVQPTVGVVPGGTRSPVSIPASRAGSPQDPSRNAASEEVLGRRRTATSNPTPRSATASATASGGMP